MRVGHKHKHMSDPQVCPDLSAFSRVMELFTQDWSLSRKLRMPAISRLQKVHNVDLALKVLRAKGVDLKDERGNCPFAEF